MYNPMGRSGSKCSITPLFCHIFIGKSVYWDCAWYNEYLGRIYQKWNILTLVHVFAHNSKSILPQSASFSHAGTHLLNCKECIPQSTLTPSERADTLQDFALCYFMFKWTISTQSYLALYMSKLALDSVHHHTTWLSIRSLNYTSLHSTAD